MDNLTSGVMILGDESLKQNTLFFSSDFKDKRDTNQMETSQVADTTQERRHERHVNYRLICTLSYMLGLFTRILKKKPTTTTTTTNNKTKQNTKKKTKKKEEKDNN